MLNNSSSEMSAPKRNRFGPGSRASAGAPRPPADTTPLHPLPSIPIVSNWDWALAEARKSTDFDDKFKKWEERRGAGRDWAAIRGRFEASRQTVLYRLAPSDVTKVMNATDHALGWMKGPESRLRHLKKIANATPPYPVMLLLHDLLESLGRVPTWSDFSEYLFANPDLCMASLWKAADLGPQTEEDGWASQKLGAIRYRLGNFYYSFLREIHLIVVLRRVHGLDVRYHPLLDAEWKIDAVCSDFLIELYIYSVHYKGSKTARKQLCEEQNPGRLVEVVEMEAKQIFGECWRCSDTEIGEAADGMKALIPPIAS